MQSTNYIRLGTSFEAEMPMQEPAAPSFSKWLPFPSLFSRGLPTRPPPERPTFSLSPSTRRILLIVLISVVVVASLGLVLFALDAFADLSLSWFPPSSIPSPSSLVPGLPLNASSRCVPSCYDYGTCNEEMRRCDCPAGFTGDDCSTFALLPCTFDRGTVHIPCSSPSSCACALACEKFYFYEYQECFDERSIAGLPGRQSWSDLIAHAKRVYQNTTGRGGEFGREPVPEDEVASGLLSLERPLDQCPRSCSGHGSCAQELGCRCPWYYNGEACEGAGHVRCINDCGGAGRGSCVEGTCWCRRGYFGVDCSMALATDSRVTVELSPPFQWAPNVTSQLIPGVAMRYYVYDLPGQFNTWQFMHSTYVEADLGVWFLERLLSSPHRTTDPNEADFFYIPLFLAARMELEAAFMTSVVEYVRTTWPFWKRSNGADHVVMDSNGWGRCNWEGKEEVLGDAIVLSVWGFKAAMTPDEEEEEAEGEVGEEGQGQSEGIGPGQDVAGAPAPGEAGSEEAAAAAAGASASPAPVAGQPQPVEGRETIAEQEQGQRVGQRLRQQQDLVRFSRRSRGLVGSTEKGEGTRRKVKKLPCFVQGKDIVIPPYIPTSMYKEFRIVQETLLDLKGTGSTPSQPSSEGSGPADLTSGEEGTVESERHVKEKKWRKYLMTFKGVKGDPVDPSVPKGEISFSFGVRQRVFELFGGKDMETGFKLQETEGGGDDFGLGFMQESVFCLATTEWGWTDTATLSILAGCIPLVIQPNVEQPFSGDGLDWNDFAVMMNPEDVPRLPELLRRIPDNEVRRKQARLRQLWPAVTWASSQHNPFEFLPPDADAGGDRHALAQFISGQDAFARVLQALDRRRSKPGQASGLGRP